MDNSANRRSTRVTIETVVAAISELGEGITRPSYDAIRCRLGRHGNVVDDRVLSRVLSEAVKRGYIKRSRGGSFALVSCVSRDEVHALFVTGTSSKRTRKARRASRKRNWTRRKQQRGGLSISGGRITNTSARRSGSSCSSKFSRNTKTTRKSKASASHKVLKDRAEKAEDGVISAKAREVLVNVRQGTSKSKTHLSDRARWFCESSAQTDGCWHCEREEELEIVMEDFDDGSNREESVRLQRVDYTQPEQEICRSRSRRRRRCDEECLRSLRGFHRNELTGKKRSRSRSRSLRRRLSRETGQKSLDGFNRSEQTGEERPRSRSSRRSRFSESSHRNWDGFRRDDQIEQERSRSRSPRGTCSSRRGHRGSDGFYRNDQIEEERASSRRSKRTVHGESGSEITEERPRSRSRSSRAREEVRSRSNRRIANRRGRRSWGELFVFSDGQWRKVGKSRKKHRRSVFDLLCP
ncbi:hypothetical protein BaRGS_00012324 [Batillaria attramentaria]|uniref:H15 domain-containing protein n=1 Tax=Batillaria attramentaria TaxID=370345 RepID=A0ABD0LAI7_9CAEN